MDSLSDNLTQETVPCLFINIYHPEEEESNVFRFINFNEQQTYKAHEMVTFGRKDTCNIQLNHTRASRLQFQIQAFLKADISGLQFEIKNLSDKFSLYVNGQELRYLQKQLLPWKCILTFTEFQFYLEQEGGETVDEFAVAIKKSSLSLCQGKGPRFPSQIEPPYLNEQHNPQEPVEVDEDLDQYMSS
ncbi:TRAF-interacting protein with FHA domain-containing protein A-like [Heterodontus francisci]|uniref:TRAF-interacting protein with FHA domain-containing protein A-like n=1 Tax=Heterodontus francisci TaxID=7792 RepID=UPI00355B1BFF